MTLPVPAEITFFDQDDAFIMGYSTTGPTTGGVGTGGGGCNEDFEIVIPPEIIIIQGYAKQINITIKNTGSCVLYNINASLGVPSGWNSNSYMIGELYGNKNRTVNLSVTPPSDAVGNYTMTVKADALSRHKSKELFVLVNKEEEPLADATNLSFPPTESNTPKEPLADATSPSFPPTESNTPEEKQAGIPSYVYFLTALAIVLIPGWFYHRNLRRKK
jgi:hypothetical protein